MSKYIDVTARAALLATGRELADHELDQVAGGEGSTIVTEPGGGSSTVIPAVR